MRDECRSASCDDVAAAVDREIALRARVAELEERLEIKWAWDGNGNRVPAPPNMPDGIEARNETIKLMDRNIEALRARVAELEKEAGRYRWVRDTPCPPALVSVIHMQQNGKWDPAIDAAMKEGKVG